MATLTRLRRSKNLQTLDRDQRTRGQNDQDSSPSLPPENSDPLHDMEDRINERPCFEQVKLPPADARQPGDHRMNEFILGIESKVPHDRFQCGTHVRVEEPEEAETECK